MDHVVKELTRILPGTAFTPGDTLHWSPKTQTVTYHTDDSSIENIWGLLHEAGHAQLDHQSYESDIELLQLEVYAWDTARILGQQLDVIIDDEHIQDCLDTYRDWLHQRSTCPRCGVVTFQESSRQYCCYNCTNTWTVSASRFCRPYRLGAETSKNRPKTKPQTIFS